MTISYLNKFLIIVLGAASLYAGAFLYPGNFLIYIVFSILFCGSLIFSLNLNYFFPIFIFGLLWLGFWLKLVAAFFFRGGRLFEPVGFFDYSPQSWDRVLLVSIVGSFAFIAAVFIFREMLNKKDNYSRVELPGSAKLKFIFFTLMTLSILVTFFNAKYAIYQRAGRGFDLSPIYIDLFIKWCLLFGLNGFALGILDWLLLNRQRGIGVYLVGVLFIDWMINFSLLSRGYVLSSGAVLLLFFMATSSYKYHYRLKHSVCILVIYGVFAITSVWGGNYFRQLKFENKEVVMRPDVSIIAESTGLSTNTQLIFGRWVGLEGVAAVVSYPEVGLKFWAESFGESKDLSQASFYDRNVVRVDTGYLNIGEKAHYAINIPGIIGFSYYSGSLFLVFLICFMAGLFGLYLERLALFFSGSRIFSGFIAYLVAYRYLSFGYVPKDTYMFICSLIVTIGLIGLLRKLLAKT